MFSTTVFGCAFHLPRDHEDWATVSEPTWRRQLTEAAHRHLSEEFTKRRENLVVRMGGSDSKLNFRKAVVQLTTKKTVSKVMKMYSQLSFSRSLAEGFVGLNRLLVNVHLINSSQVNFVDRFRLSKRQMTPFGISFGLSRRRLSVTFLLWFLPRKSELYETRIPQIWRRFATRWVYVLTLLKLFVLWVNFKLSKKSIWPVFVLISLLFNYFDGLCLNLQYNSKRSHEFCWSMTD